MSKNLPKYFYPELNDCEPIPPAILYAETETSNEKANHLARLAQFCADFSREYKFISSWSDDELENEIETRKSMQKVSKSQEDFGQALKRKSHPSFRPYVSVKSAEIKTATNQEERNTTILSCNWRNGPMNQICGRQFEQTEEFDEHIKYHMSSEIFSDFQFYHKIKNSLENKHF